MINNLLKNFCLIIFALIAPITLPAGGIQKSINHNKLHNTKEIILSSNTSLYSFPEINSKELLVLDMGLSLSVLRNWKVNETEIWVRVELASNKLLDDPNKITKGWIKMYILDIDSISIVLCGSTFGLILRIFIQNNLKINIGFNIQNTSIVNFISSFILGILVALDFINNKILLLFYVGFLGCFSTFSSFVYQLFVLFQKRKFMLLFFHYTEVIILSFLCFYLGYYLMQIFK